MYKELPRDSKFGLPKPDFRNIPKKRARWPIFIGILLSALLLGKFMYDLLYVKWYSKPTASLEVFSMPQNAQTKRDTFSTTTDVEVNESVSGDEAFEPYKKNKPKEDIETIQKWLGKETSNYRELVKPGTYQEIQIPQGVYHLVVVSHLSKEAAMHSVRSLIKKNLGVYLIAPKQGERYYRVTIAHSKTLHEAEEHLKRLTTEYKDLFIYKY